MKAIEQYFHVVLFIMLYKVALTFKSVDETLVCGHLNEWFIRLDKMVLSSLSVLNSTVWPFKSLFIHFHLNYFQG